MYKHSLRVFRPISSWSVQCMAVSWWRELDTSHPLGQLLPNTPGNTIKHTVVSPSHLTSTKLIRNWVLNTDIHVAQIVRSPSPLIIRNEVILQWMYHNMARKFGSLAVCLHNSQIRDAHTCTPNCQILKSPDIFVMSGYIFQGCLFGTHQPNLISTNISGYMVYMYMHHQWDTFNHTHLVHCNILKRSEEQHTEFCHVLVKTITNGCRTKQHNTHIVLHVHVDKCIHVHVQEDFAHPCTLISST